MSQITIILKSKKIEGIKVFKKTGMQLVNANLRPKKPRIDSYVGAVLKKIIKKVAGIIREIA